MSGAQRSRADVLVDLIEFRRPIDAAVNAIAALDWDSDQPLVVLRCHHVRELLGRFEGGKVSAAEVEAWAEALECRDDVGYEPDYDRQLREFLFQASTPELNEPISSDFARRWREQLGGP